MTEYATVVADPPWSPSLGSTWRTARTDKARPQKHYATLSVAEIVDLRPPTAKQAHLWLWCLNQHIDWGVHVAREWGFEPVQMLTWCKPGLGVGRFQCNTEQVLVARKGSRHGNPFGATGGTWFEWPRGRHSAKPDEFFALVERVSPGPYLEMYARTERRGWDHFGNEAPAPIELRVNGVRAASRTFEPEVGIRPDCPTCTWPNRETVDMVCMTCGFDYGQQRHGERGDE